MSARITTRAAAVSALLVFCMATASHVEGRGRRRVLAVSPPASGLSLSFLGGELFDAGSVQGRTARTVTLRIGPSTREPNGTATVRAFVELADPRCTIRVDGIVLGTAPRVVRRHAPVGIPFTHRIEIEIPREAAEGPLQTSIGWEVTTE
jgi:hypothetical protein